MKIDWKKVLAVVLGFVILVGVAVSMGWLKPAHGPSEVSLMVQNESSTVADVTGWKTYRNEELGFEMKHPPNLEVKIGDVGYGGSRGFYIAFVESGKSRSYFTIEVFDVGSVEDINEAVSLAIKTDMTSLDKRVIQVDGRNAYYYQEVPGFVPYEEIFVIKGSRLYGFVKPVYRGHEIYFEKILSTFKFIEP